MSSPGSAVVVRVDRPPILSAIDPLAHGVLEASAGTGKTFILEHLVVDLLLRHGLSLEQILVVTFTDKATREMRERLRERLRAILDEVSDGEGVTPPANAAVDPENWWIDEPARRRLEDALSVFDRAPISTIHSFCQRVLTERAFDCARLLSQEQVESRSAFGRGYRDELRAALSRTSQTARVIEHALATVGPERLEAALYRWYTEPGIPEPRFDPALAEDSLRRLPSRAELASGGRVARLLASGLRQNPKLEVPRRLMTLAPLVEAVRSGRSIFDVLLELWEWAATPATSNLTTLGYLCHHLARSPSRELRPLAHLMQQLRGAAGGPLSVLVGDLLPRILLRITDHKADHGQIDFDDMLRMLRDALYASEGDTLVRALADRYRVALVDEFQDTDRVQWDIFRRLFVETSGSLVVIGDPKQAIYGFRNADVHTYHEARGVLVSRGASTVPLTVNYRSSSVVVDSLNHLFDQGFFTGVNRYPHPVRSGRPALRALDAKGTEVTPITLFHLIGRPRLDGRGVRRVLSNRIALEIRRLLEDGLSLEEGDTRRRLRPSDIQVLCRSRADADAVAAALTAEQVPFAMYKQEGLFQAEAARALWDLLGAIATPRDPVSRMRAFLTPFFGVPLGELANARDAGPEHPLMALLLQWHQLANRQRWASLFRSVLIDSGLSRRVLFAGLGERDLTDYAHLLEVLLEEVHHGHRSLAQLRTRLAAFIDGRELPVGESANLHRVPSEEAAVQVLTMHKSKGLEADVVFLAGGFSEPAPSRLDPRVFHDAEGQRVAWMGEVPDDVRERMACERREEAERLLYVALTRARVKLYLPYLGVPPPSVALDETATIRLEDPPGFEADERSPEQSQYPLSIDEPGSGDADLPELHLRAMPGPYRVLNDRLEMLVQAGRVPGPWFEHQVLEVRPRPRSIPRDERASRAALAMDGPEPSPPSEDDVRAWVAKVRRGFEVTSYSAMKRAAERMGPAHPNALSDLTDRAGLEEVTEREHHLDLDEASRLEVRSEEPKIEGEIDDLPGGAAVGVFLHEVLEHLPFDEIHLLPDVEVPTREAALAPSHQRLFERCARRNSVPIELVPRAARLLRAAMSARVRLGDGAILHEGLRSVTRGAAEFPFVHPIPESHHPRLDQPPPSADRGALRIERGYVRGVIDLLFEHEGRYHILDYKSDRLVVYNQDTLTAHVGAHYTVQARLYTLGTLRSLRIHDEASYDARFGGLLYAFLRGMSGERDEGVVAFRPAFSEVLAWESALLADRAWGYPLPARAPA